MYIFDHTLSWGIKNCTPYPIVRINRVRVNEVLLYIVVLDDYFNTTKERKWNSLQMNINAVLEKSLQPLMGISIFNGSTKKFYLS